MEMLRRMRLRRKRTSRSNWAFRFRRMTGQVGGWLARPRPLGCLEPTNTIVKALLEKLTRLAGPVRWTQSAINAS